MLHFIVDFYFWLWMSVESRNQNLIVGSCWVDKSKCAKNANLGPYKSKTKDNKPNNTQQF